jgi:hypothetical protein
MKVLALAAAILVSGSANAAFVYSGQYTGKMNGDLTTISVSQSGDTLSAQLVSSPLLVECGASIGQMTNIDTDTDDNGVTKIDWAEFAFDPGTCTYIEGRSITLDFKHTGTSVSGLTASLLYSITTEPGRCHPIPNGGMICDPPTTRYNYYSGRLKKQ